MARERIDLLIDVLTGNSSSTLGRLRTDLSNADGAFDKTRVASSALWDGLKAHAATASVAAAGALVAFGVKAVGAFQETALGAGQLRDALGVTAEEASRLQEVAGDLGIPVSALESTIGRMNRTASTTPEAFDNINAAIIRNRDGTANVTETFLGTIDALNKIPDASERARRAQEIFGRSWQDISELVATGADGVRRALEDVEDAKVIDDAEVAKARRFRDVMDELKGVVESATLAVGEGLVPVITDAAETLQDLQGPTNGLIAAYEKLGDVPLGDRLQDIIEPAGVLRRGIEELTTVVGLNNDEIKASVGELDPLQGALIIAADAAGGMTKATDDATDALDDAEGQADDTAGAVDDLETHVYDLGREWDTLKGKVSDDQAWIDVQDSFADVHAAAVESWNAASTGAVDAAQKARDHATDVNNLKNRVIDYGREVLGLPERQVTDILAMIDQGRINDAERRLNDLSRERIAYIRAVAVGNFPHLAEGGTAPPGGALAGENFRPELLNGGMVISSPTLVPGGTKVTGESETARLLDAATNGTAVALSGAGTAGAAVFNVNVSAPYGTNPDDFARKVSEALLRSIRTTGAGSLRRALGI